MEKHHRSFSYFVVLACLLLSLIAAGQSWADVGTTSSDQVAGNISERSIQKLQDEFENTFETESTLQRRRSLKNISRRCLSLIKRQPKAANRFELLGLVYECQKEMLVLQSSQRNQSEFVETCKKLLQAPDKYANKRFEADFLLTQWRLDSENASNDERSMAIAELADRYRNTSAEIDSLITAAEVAFNLGDANLLAAFRYTLSSKYGTNLKSIEFLRERFSFDDQSLQFRGKFKRIDGQTLSFPLDRIGHTYMACFWSLDAPHLKERFREIKRLQNKHRGKFEVYSFNLDELEDAGANYLKKMKLDWIPMHLPGGPNNQQFRAYTTDKNFLIKMVNPNGYMTMTPIGSIKKGGARLLSVEHYVDVNIDTESFRTFTQTLRIGDLMVTDPFNSFDPNRPAELNFDTKDSAKSLNEITWSDDDVSIDELSSIQQCFVAVPMRYKISQKEATERYEKAERLCTKAIKKHPDSKNIWFVYNRRIIALLGLWNLKASPKSFNKAVTDAKKVMSLNTPKGAGIVAEFCLAKNAIRLNESADSKQIVKGFYDKAIKTNTPAATLAAATILAIDGNVSELLLDYREALFKSHTDNPRLWPVITCMFDKGAFKRLLRANFDGSEHFNRAGIPRIFEQSEAFARKLNMKLRKPDGSLVDFPDGDPKKINVIVFAESGRAHSQLASQISKMNMARYSANIVLPLITDDPRLISKRLTVPGGLNNPNILRLGIIDADHRPNTFIVRHDGAVLWSITGINYLSGKPGPVAGKIRRHIKEHLSSKRKPPAVEIYSDLNPTYPAVEGSNTPRTSNYADIVKKRSTKRSTKRRYKKKK